MKTYLVTGAAGFIGANYLKYILAKHDDIRVVVLDALTYAGNLGTIASDIDNERCFFVKGDICDRDLADQLFSEYKFDYIVNFAAESHVDRSIENPQLFLQTNILGTQNLLDAARRAWVTGKDENGYPTWRKDVRYHQVSTDEVYGSLGAEGFFTETTPLCPHSPYSASKTSADMIVMAYRDTYKMPVTITRCSNNYGPYHFPEKLIPLIIKNILEGKKLPVYGEGKYVEAHHNQQIYLNHKLLEKKELNLAEIQQKSAEFLMQFSGVNEAYSANRLLLGSWTPEIYKIRNGYHRKRSGDLVIDVLPGWTIVNENGGDNKVVRHSYIPSPLIFMGHSVKPAIIQTPVTIDHIAPTLAHFMRIRAPNACTSAPITDLR